MKAPDITVKLYIHHNQFNPVPFVATCDMSRWSGLTLIDVREITIPAPQLSAGEITQKCVEQLRRQQSSIIDSAHVQASAIEDRIKNLQCIEHFPAAMTSR
ncbi:hypothetical protein [Dickeya fangzhongdai]|uniref:Uncharacterized protein n=1 Tax=Dickeya fangzhongdai TaxID=1778540 RepID=A0A2K8QP85_9GAMM|nr:hypothetical protein [Dickeya fangzhongdai]ATZ95329.1 hypothetical protein CVE23_15890 [Dickeya fangzhongdai]QOH48771.1 hypothetical protein DYD82_15960 [Dickeya fangzhongdai]QOH53075.1 hypothetical protein DYD83_15960 [Dickeya fangzhongdai]GGC04597.1 hypothetical protein GCM10007171_22090 [Dickeya fangzhongdai]